LDLIESFENTRGVLSINFIEVVSLKSVEDSGRITM
jgi:hypothetical protein